MAGAISYLSCLYSNHKQFTNKLKKKISKIKKLIKGPDKLEETPLSSYIIQKNIYKAKSNVKGCIHRT